MARISYAILLGLIGAAIIHIVILLLLPFTTDKDAWSRLAAEGELFEVVPIPRNAVSPIGAVADPFIHASACRFDLSQGIAHVTAKGGVPFWSVSIYNRRGHNIYNFNDRTVTAEALDLAVVSPAQMLDLRKDLPDQLAGSLFVEVVDPLGIVVVRAFQPDRTYASKVSVFFDAERCQPL